MRAGSNFDGEAASGRRDWSEDWGLVGQSDRQDWVGGQLLYFRRSVEDDDGEDYTTDETI